MRVAILDDFHNIYNTTNGIRRLREHAEVAIFTDHTDPAALRGFDALIANRERTHFTREVLQKLPDVKIIAQVGNHAYHIDLAAAEECGIIIGKATGGTCRAAGELTIGLMIAVMRQIPTMDQTVKNGGWPSTVTSTLHGKTLGIVGLGRIGRHVAKIAAACEMKLLAWGRTLTADAAAQVGAECVELDDLMTRSDVISVHATMSDDTKGLIDARRLALMKPTAFLINTARGPIVDEVALCAALATRQIAGAGLDVFNVEPLPMDHPLSRLPNVVLTPHTWATDGLYNQFADAAADILIDYANGKEVPRFLSKQ